MRVIAFIDQAKAFDKVQHQTILTLQQIDIGGTVMKWFANYLTDYHQRVFTNRRLMDVLQPVQQGVPRGSIPGPLQFNLCLTCFPQNVTKAEPLSASFADDKTSNMLHLSHLQQQNFYRQLLGKFQLKLAKRAFQ